MAKTTLNMSQNSSNSIRNTVQPKSRDDKTSVVFAIPAFSWNEIPPQKGFHTLDALLKKVASVDDGTHLKDARNLLAKVYSQNGATLKSIRMEKNLSQTELAEAIQTNQYIISCYERGKHDMSYKTMEKICEVLQIDLNTLGIAIKNTARDYHR